MNHLIDKFSHLFLERAAQEGGQTSTYAMRPLPKRIPLQPVEEPSNNVSMNMQEMKMQNL
jgi:hypothetical protein